MGHTFLGAWPSGAMTKKRELRRDCEDASFGETCRRSESEVHPYPPDLRRLWEETFQARLDQWVGMAYSEQGNGTWHWCVGVTAIHSRKNSASAGMRGRIVSGGDTIWFVLTSTVLDA